MDQNCIRAGEVNITYKYQIVDKSDYGETKEYVRKHVVPTK